MKKFLQYIKIIPNNLGENDDETFVDWTEPNSNWSAEQKELYLKVQKAGIYSAFFPILTFLFGLLKQMWFLSISWYWIIIPIFLSVVHFYIAPIKASKKYYKYVDEKNNLKKRYDGSKL